MYNQTEAGKAIRTRSKVVAAKYKVSSEGKVSAAKYQASPKGKAVYRRWLQTPKGKAYIQAMVAKACAGQNYHQFLSFKNEAFRDQLPCAKCGVPWIDGPRGVTHEVDHIVPRALGGAHTRDNLQILCYECHLAKTSSDLKDITRAKKTVECWK